MRGHTDTITSIALSNCGSFVLTNSMDNTLRTWDIRPFVTKERQIKMFVGHKHNFEMNLLKCAWSPDDSKITAGSADRYVFRSINHPLCSLSFLEKSWLYDFDR